MFSNFSTSSVNKDWLSETTSGNLTDLLNDFFLHIVKNLQVPNHSSFEPFVGNINDPTLKGILKYRNHPTILLIQDKFQKNVTNFCFAEISLEEIK